MAAQKRDCSHVLKIVADETRLQVLMLLLKRPSTVTELNKKIKITQSLLSHHLKLLRDGGLVETERKGKSIQYKIASNEVKQTKKGTVNLDCCELVFS